MSASFLSFFQRGTFGQIIINYSNRHKLHLSLALLYGLALARMFHETVRAMLSSLKFHMFFDVVDG